MELHLNDSVKLLIKTWPFLALKFLVYALLSLGFLIFWGIMLTIAFMAGGTVSLIVIVVGIILTFGFFLFIRSYVLYLVKAGHIATLAELTVNGNVPAGTNQISYGFAKVKSRFVAASAYFIVDGLIRWVTRSITGFINRIGSMIPIANVRTIFGILSRIIAIFLGNVDEAILSYVFLNPKKDVVEASKDGLVLYSKVWKNLFTSSTIIVLITYAVTLAIFLVAFIPAAMLASVIPIDILKDMTLIVALVIAALVKIALIDQFTLVYMIVTYNKSIQGQTPDSEALDKLERVVPQFGKELEKAKNKVMSKGQPLGSGTQQPQETPRETQETNTQPIRENPPQQNPPVQQPPQQQPPQQEPSQQEPPQQYPPQYGQEPSDQNNENSIEDYNPNYGNDRSWKP